MSGARQHLLFHDKASSLKKMNNERLKRITLEEGKCGGRPCIRGLRIRVSDILELLASGASFEEILSDYPSLERETSSPPLNTPPTGRPRGPPSLVKFLVDNQLPANNS